ncbi:hypothetical protein [Leptospira noumeaensis]|nr:hypothetical protein [Leptospira noumeaensis]
MKFGRLSGSDLTYKYIRFDRTGHIVSQKFVSYVNSLGNKYFHSKENEW